MYFEWDDRKNRQNILKHDVRFETAALVFEGPHALTRLDPFSENEERWITLGAVGAKAVLFVVHTSLDRGEEEVIRIISARAATPRERRSYEEAEQRAKARYRRHFRQKNREY